MFSIFILVVVIPLSLIFAAEILSRIYVHFRYGITGKSYGIYMFDKELGAVHRPNSYNNNSVMNNWGFRNIEDTPEQKPQGVTRIYCSGASATFCYNLRTEESWPSLLQHKLREIKGHEHDEVLNAGEICFTISQEFALAKRFIPRLKPDIVILYGTGINEILGANALIKEGKDLDELLKKKQWGVFSRKLDQARFLKRNSVLVRIFDYYIKEYFLEHFSMAYSNQSYPRNYVHPWVMENFEHTLRDYIDFLQRNGCKVILVRYGDNGVDNWLITEIRRFRERAVAIAKEKGAIICDLVNPLENHPQRKNLYLDTGVHVRREGADVVASELFKTILEPLSL